QSDVVAGRRTRKQRQTDCGRGVDGRHRSDAFSVDLRKPDYSGVGLGDRDRLGGYAALCGTDRGAADDRAVSVGESGRSIVTDDERQVGVSRRPRDVAFELRVLVACPCCAYTAVQLLEPISENVIVTQTRVRIPLGPPLQFRASVLCRTAV